MFLELMDFVNECSSKHYSLNTHSCYSLPLFQTSCIDIAIINVWSQTSGFIVKVQAVSTPLRLYSLGAHRRLLCPCVPRRGAACTPYEAIKTQRQGVVLSFVHSRCFESLDRVRLKTGPNHSRQINPTSLSNLVLFNFRLLK